MKLTRPHIKIILAMTADGKIADRTRSAARFGSSADKDHLEQQIATVDAVIFGANTLRAYGTTMTVSNPALLAMREETQFLQPIQIVCSASGNLDRHYRFFRQAVPRWLLTTTKGAKNWQDRGEEFDRILICDSLANSIEIDWIAALANIFAAGIKRLAVLGGSELIGSLLELEVIDELWLTVCPFLFGGNDAPTPIGGLGLTVARAQRLELLEVKQIDSELFLHYRRVGE